MKKPTINRLSQFDREPIELPRTEPFARIIALPLKTIFYNRNRTPECNVDKVLYSADEVNAFFKDCGATIRQPPH